MTIARDPTVPQNDTYPFTQIKYPEVVKMHPAPGTIAALVSQAKPHSDMSLESLTRLAYAFSSRHESRSGAWTLEIGTRKGGSALLMLLLLQEIYGKDAPMLFTVDPYGGKPYKGGDIVFEGLYGDKDYVAAKKLLAPWPNHAHWLETGEMFLERPTWVWLQGEVKTRQFSFVLLDGDHDAKTIENELNDVAIFLAQSCTIVVDNSDRDPQTHTAIDRWCSDTRRTALATYHPGNVSGNEQTVITREA